jgi:hypothetical protein
MTHAVLLAVACAALAVAVIAVGLSSWLIYATRDARTKAHRHERRTRDQGPPPGVPERRHRSPDDARARRRDLDDPQWQVAEPTAGPSTPSGAGSANPLDVRREDPATYPPRPAARHRDPNDPATVEHAPPTADMRTLPPPGSIPR